MFRTLDVVAQSVAEVDCNGWISAKKAEQYFGRVATADVVFDYLTVEESNRPLPSESHIAKAKVIIARLEEEIESSNEYLAELAYALSQEFIDEDDIHIVCSSVNAYEVVLENEAIGELPPSEFVGEFDENGKGVRLKDMMWTVLFSAGPYKNDFGTSYLNVCLLDGIHRCVWFTGINMQEEYGKKAVLEVDGTPKEHSVRDDVKQTMFTRCKIKNVISQTSTNDALFNDDEDDGLFV